MKKIKSIEQQFKLIYSFFCAYDEHVTLPILFQNQKINLFNPKYINDRRFINDEPIKNGELLGNGGSKKVYYVNGVAVFLMGSANIDDLERMINEEVSISHQMRLLGLHTQILHKGFIGIYDPNEKCYLDYPCMYADSFPKLSKEKGIEVFDTKNRYRFGVKCKLFLSDEGCMDASMVKAIFQDVVRDLALLLYLGFEVNLQDSFNLAFISSNRDGLSSSVRLFLYDFSSKYYIPQIDPRPINTLPADSEIKKLLKTIIRDTLEADHIARTGWKQIGTPLCIETFFEKIYPEIEIKFVNDIKSTIIDHIRTKQQFEERITPKLIESTQIKEALSKLGFYSSEKVFRVPTHERSKSCSF